MCWVKVTGSVGAGNASGSWVSAAGANAEILDPGFASQAHHHRGTGMCIGGLAPCCAFSSPSRYPHSIYDTNAARNSGSADRPASSADRQIKLTHRARCASVSPLPRCCETIRVYQPRQSSPSAIPLLFVFQCALNVRECVLEIGNRPANCGLANNRTLDSG